MANEITCDTCEETMPEYEVSLCSPQFKKGQIQRGFLTLLNEHSNFTPVADPVITTSVNNPVAWSNRQDQTGQSDGAIITVHMIASKPRPEATKTDYSMGRSLVTGKKHTVPFKVDEVNSKADSFWRKVSKCGLRCGAWFETSGLNLLGNANGVEIPINVEINADRLIPVERNGIITWEGEMVWEELGTEEMIASVVPDAPEPTVGS